MDMTIFTLWMLNILNVYKLFLQCLKILLISWTQLYFLKACCSGFLADVRPAFRPGYYSPLVRQYCLQGPTYVMGIMNNFHSGG